MNKQAPDIRTSYDRVAERYAEEYFDELSRKPFDCDLLDGFAENLRGQGTVCDIGCGPGHIARYLKDRGVNISGVDLSAEMAEYLREAGFEEVNVVEREPYEFEYPTQRVYAFARK